MCLSPIPIRNVNRGSKFAAVKAFKDTKSLMVSVPCGVCAECLRARQSAIAQRCAVEALYGYPFFASLSIRPSSMLKCVCSDGYEIPYADIRDLSLMFKRLRNYNAFGRPFRYLAISELGAKRSRPHYHVLLFLQRLPDDNVYTPLNLEPVVFDTLLKFYARNYGTRRVPDYRPMCDYVRKYRFGRLHTTYDCHYVRPEPRFGTTRSVVYYVTKYMLKASSAARRLQQALRLNLPENEYRDVWRLVSPRSIKSLNFGFGAYGDYNGRRFSPSDRQDYLAGLPSASLIRSSVARSRFGESLYPLFFDPETGRSTPLAHYYKEQPSVYSADDYVHFWYMSPYQSDDNVILPPDRPEDMLDRSVVDFARVCDTIDDRCGRFASVL